MMCKRSALSVLLAAFAFCADCAELKFLNDIPYRTTCRTPYQKERCKLDIRYLKGSTGFPTVVWFHGGGLTAGGKHLVRFSDATFGEVAANYRLMNATNGVQGADCIDDAAAAVAWTLEHIAEYGGDPKKVFVSGMSAGGYLTMMVGMAPQYLRKYGHSISELAGIAPISGQATTHFNVRKFSGDNDPQFLPKIDALAPLHYCSKDIPPIISICGEEPWEWQCRSEENRLLIASCRALGHKKAWFVSTPFSDHGRAYLTGIPYLELFMRGQMPGNLQKAK